MDKDANYTVLIPEEELAKWPAPTVVFPDVSVPYLRYTYTDSDGKSTEIHVSLHDDKNYELSMIDNRSYVNGFRRITLVSIDEIDKYLLSPLSHLGWTVSEWDNQREDSNYRWVLAFSYNSVDRTYQGVSLAPSNFYEIVYGITELCRRWLGYSCSFDGLFGEHRYKRWVKACEASVF